MLLGGEENCWHVTDGLLTSVTVVVGSPLSSFLISTFNAKA